MTNGKQPVPSLVTLSLLSISLPPFFSIHYVGPGFDAMGYPVHYRMPGSISGLYPLRGY